jgi:hypothetical protein
MSDDRSEQIRQRAYQIWENLGRPKGGHDEHWVQAEAEILADEAECSSSVPEGSEDLGAKIASKDA